MTITALRSVFVGVGGSLVLAVFLATFLPLEKVLFGLPLAVAFNGLLTGYRLVELLKERIDNIMVFSTVLGIGEGTLVFMAVNLAGSHMAHGFALTGRDLAVYMIVAGVTSCLGARLAVRYFKL